MKKQVMKMVKEAAKYAVPTILGGLAWIAKQVIDDKEDKRIEELEEKVASYEKQETETETEKVEEKDVKVEDESGKEAK